jgi:hypothetical protein
MSESQPAERRGFSLTSPEGVEAVANLGRLARREVTLEELGDERYGYADGILRIDVDDESFDLLMGNRTSS